MPVKTPDSEPMVAIEVLPLAHTPPVGLPVMLTEEPWHTCTNAVYPRITGCGFTVTVVVA